MSTVESDTSTPTTPVTHEVPVETMPMEVDEDDKSMSKLTVYVRLITKHVCRNYW